MFLLRRLIRYHIPNSFLINKKSKGPSNYNKDAPSMALFHFGKLGSGPHGEQNNQLIVNSRKREVGPPSNQHRLPSQIPFIVDLNDRPKS